MSGSLRLPGYQVDWLLRGALAAASKEEVTPVICAVKWTVADGRVTVIATDRYRVHQLYVAAPEGAPDGEFLMSGRQAALLLKSWHAPRRSYRTQVVELAWVDAEPMPDGFSGTIGRRLTGRLEFTIHAHSDKDADRITHEAAQVRGNFPPVERLFPDEDAADFKDGPRAAQMALNPEHLSATRWLRTGQASLRFVPPPAGDKPAPMLVVNTEGTARALLQPHLNFDGKRYGDG